MDDDDGGRTIASLVSSLAHGGSKSSCRSSKPRSRGEQRSLLRYDARRSTRRARLKQLDRDADALGT